MKNQSIAVPTAPITAASEDDIRDYAYHLYQQGNCLPGHDVDNWLEASACLKANIPAHCSHSRLHQYINGQKTGELHAVST